MKVLKRMFGSTIVVAILLCVCSISASAHTYSGEVPAQLIVSDWAAGSILEATKIGLIPEDLQCEYQKDITRAEFTKMAIYFLAAQYNYQDFSSDNMVVESSVEDFICYFLDKSTQDNTPVYHKKEYWVFLPEDLRQEAESMGITADDYDWRSILNTMNPFFESDDPACFEYKLFINAAYVLNIITGYEDGTFRPESPITREEAATMLLRVYRIYDKHQSLSVSDTAVNYSDIDLIGTWAKEAVTFMSNYHIMNGTDTLTFSPGLHYTREQCIVTFLRLYNNMPISKVKSNVPRFSTIEEDIDHELSMPFFSLSYRWDTHDAVVLYGTYGGIGTLRNSRMHIFYFMGGKKSLSLSGNSFSVSDDHQYIFYKSGENSYQVNIETAQIQEM